MAFCFSDIMIVGSTTLIVLSDRENSPYTPHLRRTNQTCRSSMEWLLLKSSGRSISVDDSERDVEDSKLMVNNHDRVLT